MAIVDYIFTSSIVSGHGCPFYATAGSAGVDFRAAIENPLIIHPGETIKISTGLRLWIKDPSLVLFILPKSGLGNKGLVLANLVGVIDSDYQGEIIMMAWNRNNKASESITIEPGQFICQGTFLKTEQVTFAQVPQFFETTGRGENGFGSTGKGF